MLGDVISSIGLVQYDYGRKLPQRFARKETLLDLLGRSSAEVRLHMTKLKSHRSSKILRSGMGSYLGELQKHPELEAMYPAKDNDKLFQSTYEHGGNKACEKGRCDGKIL